MLSNLKRKQQVLKTHSVGVVFNLKNSNYRQEVLQYLLGNLGQDASGGDLTTKALGIGNKQLKAAIIAREDGIMAGAQEAQLFLREAGGARKSFSKIKAVFLVKDGVSFKKDEKLIMLNGPAEAIFSIERTLLNFLQRMCGIATNAHQYVSKVPKNVLVTPTRKTIWGTLDKRACVLGGAGTHRLDLGDAILVKGTHLKVMKSDLKKVLEALSLSAKKFKNKARFIEIEVGSYQQALALTKIYAALKTTGLDDFPLYVMLDNMKPVAIKKFMQYLKKQSAYKNIYVEASGGINLQNIKLYAKTGVDIVSCGALTHSVLALDLSLRVL